MDCLISIVSQHVKNEKNNCILYEKKVFFFFFFSKGIMF